MDKFQVDPYRSIDRWDQLFVWLCDQVACFRTLNAMEDAWRASGGVGQI